MATYDFKTEAGHYIEVDYPFGEAPSIGESTEHPDHGRIERVFLPGSIVMTTKRDIKPFTSMRLSPWEGKKEGWHRRYNNDPKSEDYGQPMFANRREAETFADRSEGRFAYDGLPAKCETRHRVDVKESERRRKLRERKLLGSRGLAGAETDE